MMRYSLEGRGVAPLDVKYIYDTVLEVVDKDIDASQSFHDALQYVTLLELTDAI
jgi:hypothetical protein